MAIKFLIDHEVAGPPLEKFAAGQVVKGRSHEGELHYVRRGLAAYLDEATGALSDHEGRPVQVAAKRPTAPTTGEPKPKRAAPRKRVAKKPAAKK